MKIEICSPDKAELDEKNVFTWPIWEKEVSRFDWHYGDIEECYLLEGKVTVETSTGEKITFGKGDFVTFPKGLTCVWDIEQPVRKHYNFK